MGDDIVTRLQNECCCDDDCQAVNDPCISMRAANEIERLRHYLEWWHHHAELLKCGCPSCRVIIGINETYLESVGYKGPGVTRV